MQLAAHIEAWIDSQIVKHEEKKWGSKVSAKLFMDREYVVKHINNKHGHLVAQQKEQARLHIRVVQRMYAGTLVYVCKSCVIVQAKQDVKSRAVMRKHSH